MKKPVKVAAVILGLGVVFAVGNLTGNASLDWKQNAENRAYNALLETRNEVQDEILDGTATDINNTIEVGISDTVETSADELKRLMEEYYRLRLEGITDSPEYRDLEKRIETLMNSIYGSYKTEVDKVFTEVGL
jgi:hypothetical protein